MKKEDDIPRKAEVSTGMTENRRMDIKLADKQILRLKFKLGPEKKSRAVPPDRHPEA